MFRTPENIESRIASDIAETELRGMPPERDGVYTADAVALEVGSSIRSAFPDSDILTLPDMDEPPKGIEGDVAVAMFPLSRVLRRSPRIIADTVAVHMASDAGRVGDYVDSAQAVGPYVNVVLDRSNIFAGVMSDVMDFDSSTYGHGSAMGKEVHVIDFSAPNIAKKLGIQHLPTTVVGEVLARISEANGAKAVRINHLGDFGTPFGKVLLGVERYGFDFRSTDPIGQMHQLYVRIHAEASADERVAAAAREKFMLLEQGDPELVSMWSRLRELNVAENEELYSELGVRFDTTIGESYYVEPAQSIVNRLIDSGIARTDGTGAVFVPGDTIMEYLGDGRRIGNVLLRKSDGSTLYATRDLAAIEHRIRTFSPTMIEYVVGSEQSEHFAAVFAIAGLSGLVKPETRLVHTKIGMLSGSSGKKLSSREGKTQSMADIMDDAYRTALASVQERGVVTGPDEQRALARVIANAAVSFPILRKDPSGNTTMRDQTGRAGEARTAHQIQYTHARAAQILSSEGAPTVEDMRRARYEGQITDTEWRLIKAVMDYPGSVEKAGIDRLPSHIASSTAEVAAAFNAFYEATRITGETNRDLMVARFALTMAAKSTLGAGLDTLNIGAPDRM